MQNIAWSYPNIGKEECDAVTKIMHSGWYSMGNITRDFEKRLGNFISNKKIIVTNNGTSALIAALISHNIKPADEVIVPGNTFIATINAILSVGAKPVIVDCDKDTWNLTPKIVMQNLTSKTKLVIPVDVAGSPCDYHGFDTFSKLYNIPVIIDSAESIGAYYNTLPTGHRNFKMMFIFSFHIAKQLSTIEGGAIISDSQQMHNKIKLIRNHGMEKNYYYRCLGLNFRPTDIQSAIGIEQLKKLKKSLLWRKRCVRKYKELLGNKVVYQKQLKNTSSANMFFGILTKNRNKLCKVLKQHNIDYRICWPYICNQPYHRQFINKELPNTKFLSTHILSLPLGNNITIHQIEKVCEVLNANIG